MQLILRVGLHPRSDAARARNGHPPRGQPTRRRRSGHPRRRRPPPGGAEPPAPSPTVCCRPAGRRSAERVSGETGRHPQPGRQDHPALRLRCAGAHTQLLALAETLKAPIVHALKGKEHVEWENPYDVGMTGLIGFSSGYRAMENCDTLLMLGTDFPYRQFYPRDARIIQIDLRGENIGRRVPVDLGLIGDVAATLDALRPLLKPEHAPRTPGPVRRPTTTRTPARASTNWRKAARAERCILNTSPACSANWRRTMRCSPAMSACPRSGQRATSR